jgi:PmbA protein
LKQMFACLTLADDLVFKRGIDAPTLRIDGMTLAGA